MCRLSRMCNPRRTNPEERSQTRRAEPRVCITARHKPLSSKETRQKSIFTPPGSLHINQTLQWILFARGCMRTIDDWDRRNGTAGQRMERADAPFPGGRCQRDISGWMESQATQMPFWMHLHQR